MFEAKCLRIPIKERGVFICRCQISHNTLNIKNTEIYSDSVNMFVQCKLHLQFKPHELMYVMLKNICLVFSLKEFEQHVSELQGNTLTFNGSVLVEDFNPEKITIIESFTIEVDMLSNLIKTLRDNIDILEYKLVNA